MITEYQTSFFPTPENNEKKSRVDEIFDLAHKDIRYAFNKIQKVRENVVRLSTNQLEVSEPEDIETVELLSTLGNSSLIVQLENFISYTNSMLNDLKKYQQSRLEKIDEIVETIADQIQQKRQEREESEVEYLNLIAANCYSEEMRNLDKLQYELLGMKEKTKETYEQDAA